MAHSFALLICLALCRPLPSNSFLSSWIPGDVSCPPEINQYARGQTDTMLNIRLSIGLGTDQPIFVMDGFKFQLRNDPIVQEEAGDSENETSTVHIPLPGANGPRPHLSSGAYHLNVEKHGSFINMEGFQTVEFRDGCWEMIWRDGAAAGLIVCGLKLDRDARRNDLVLEKGNVYITFPVWSKEGLKKRQADKIDVQAKYKKFEIERDDELEKMAQTSNILKKALHYRNAVAATESMDGTGLHTMVDIPSNSDVIEIGEGLQLVQTGTVWCKSGSFRSLQTLLGSAAIIGNE